MARKKHAKHSKNTILASSSARHPFSKLSASAATAVVGASLALSVTPALAQETTPAKQQDSAVVATEKKQETPKAPAATSAAPEKTTQGGGTQKLTPKAEDRASNNDAKPSQIKPDTTDTTNTKINVDENNAGTMPNAYAWGSSDNTFSEDGVKHTVTFHFAVPKTGGKITNIAIFPAQNNGLNNDKSRRGAEYYSGDAKMRQSFSGNYTFKQNDDGSVDLTMSDLFSKGTVNGGAEKYVANRSIFVYVTKDGKEDVAYKTNAFRAATLVTPKTSGSVVLKYDQPLTKEQIQAAITAAANAETARTDKQSVNDQIVAASKAKGVNTTVNGKQTQVPDTLNDKLNVKSDDAYDPNQFTAINTETSAKDAKNKTYVAGAKTLNTYMITDLGFKSGAIPLTVARYDTRIDKPIVDEADFTKLTDDQKAEICKKLAQLNNVAQDKVKFNDQGEAVISFAGVDENDAPKIALKDLVLKNLKAGEYAVPSDAADSKVKPVIISNPLGFTKAEEAAIKKALYEANKDNTELGLSATDYEKQITLDWNRGNLQASGTDNQGISNGDCENTIHVTIKTDKAIAKFDSDVKHNKLTRLVNLRTDYTLSWDAKKNKIDGRTTDEGLAWMEDGKTLVYRYDSDSGTAFNTEDVLGLLKATIKDELKQDNPQMRAELLGSEYKTVAHEGQGGQTTRSHTGYAVDAQGNPIGVLNLSKLNGSSYGGFTKPVDNSDKKMGDEQASVGDFTFDDDSKKVNVAGKTGKFMLGRLFIEPYSQYHYGNIYGEGKYNLRNSPKGINVVFVPQTKHKTKDLSASIDEHKTTKVNNTDVPTESKYYNASDKVKKDYEDALKVANDLYSQVKDKKESDLTEKQKADIDNATIKLNKAREVLDGAKTNKDGLNNSIEANGNAAQGTTAASGTQATNQFKNVSEPDFKKADGSADTERNEAAKKAKEAYDKALEDAKTLNADANATQKAVDAAKAKLDAARAKLNDFTTNKDELNNAIAQHGHVNTGDATKTDPKEKLKTADPTYQNSTKEERDAYDKAVAEAQKVVADPNASQKEVNEAIKKLKEAKGALDKNATDKASLDAAVQKSFDNPKPDDESKQSVFYKNAKNKITDTSASQEDKAAAQKAIDDYDKALKKAKDVLADDTATKADVEKAKKDLEDAENALHGDKYTTDKTALGKALADNFSGYLMPAYFNAFDLSQSKDPADAEKAKQAAEDFKKYNEAYHAAKDLMENLKQPGSTITQTDADKIKDQLLAARKVIDKYATNTSKISAALLHSLAIKASPAYQNASANTDPNSDEAKAKKAYDDALAELQKAFNDEMPQDTVDGKPGSKVISTDNVPAKGGDTTSANYLDGIQAHAKGQPLNRDVTRLLADLNKAVAGLDKFKTKTDDLIKSINEDTTTHPSPAFKNASQPSYKNDDGSDNTDKNNAAKAAVEAYGKALNKAKDLLKKPDATQKEIDNAKAALDNARKELDKYKTDTTKLKESVKKHGTKADVPAPEEGTLTSDAYRNASDPHFLTPDGKPDEQKNQQAATDKKAYDAALLKAQELLKKHDSADTPQDAQPTQQEIDKALETLDKARKKLEDNYKTVTTGLENEIKKSTPEHAPAATGDEFENTPEFKNANAKKDGTNDNADVKAYKEALKKARELVQAANPLDPAAKNSSHPTQKQINDALEALKQAKQAITDGYKTDVDKLKQAKEYAEDVFKKTPEYKNATAIKNDNNNAKHEQAGKDLDGTDQKPGLSKLIEKIATKLQDTSKMTQTEVDALVKQLVTAQKKITENYKTDATKLAREVGDKDADGNPVVPPFEASVAYKNALAKADTEENKTADDSATKKLQDYKDKLKAAQDLIAQVNSDDPNADPDKKPTQKQIDDALDALKKAKQSLVDTFKTDAKNLKDEAAKSTADGATVADADFEATPEFKNADAKKAEDGKSDNDDVAAYKAALKKARTLLEKFGDDGKPKADAKDIPSQQEVDEALKNLKEIKDKITKNYVTSPKDLQDEVDISVSGPTATGEPAFEDTGAYQRALNDKAYDEHGKPVDNDKVARYKKALAAAKAMLDKFDRATGKPKPGVTDGPTQKELDAALAELQAAKKAINESYRWINYFPLEGWSTTNPEPEQKPGEPAPAPAPAPTPAVPEPEDSLVAPESESPARVAPAHAPKHLAQTSDPTNGFAIATMLGSAFGFIVAGLKRKRNRR